MMRKCHMCERDWERVLMEPIECDFCGAFHWLCPECFDALSEQSFESYT